MSAVEPVIAGSRGFALALLAPLTEQIGTRPRIAADAAQAAPLCSGPGGLVVVEFIGSDSFRDIQDLVAEASGVRVVAAVPQKHAAADAPLRALGVEVARWDGTASAILGAVGRQLAHVAVAQPSPTPRPVAPAAAPAAAPATQIARPLPRDPPLAAHPPPPARPVPAPSPPAARAACGRQTPRPLVVARMPAAQASPPHAWPAGVPAPPEAARALGDALAGAAPAPGAGRVMACAAEVAAGLSDLERSALAAEPEGFDPEPLREAAAMRVRVAVALATAPRRGEAVDGAAVSALIGDLDALLSRVNALVEGAPERLRASLESIRDDLVRQAVRFSQRASPAEPERAPAASPVPSPQPRSRVATRPRAAARSRRAAAMWIALAIAAVLAGAFHGWRWRERRAVRAARSAGAPAGMLDLGGAAAGLRFLVPATAHEKPDPAEIARLRAAEELRGNAVLEADGVLLVVPAPPGAPAPAPLATPAPSPPQEVE